MELDPAFLLATDRRLRRLARELVSDSGADDVVQETWLAALERPGEVLSLPGWLGTVARRMAGRARRGGERRTRREAAVARADAIPSTGEILAREEARQRVVAAVLALAEPLRTTLVLRYLEDLPPRAVAARMGTPVETVRTRTRRGLELLRAELDRDFGGRERWLAALAPFSIPRPSWVSRVGTGPLAAAGAAALAVVALGWFLWPRNEPAAAPATALAAAVAAPPAPSAELGRAEAPVTVTRAPVEGSGSPAPFSAADTGSLRVQVRWLEPDMSQTPAAGVPVRVMATALENAAFHALEGVTDAAGVVVFEAVPCGKTLVSAVCRDADSATVVAGETSVIELCAAYGIDVAGLVVDAAGVAVAGAEVWGNHTDALLDGVCLVRSGSDGRFTARGVGHVWLGARAAGHAPSATRFLVAQPGADVELRLELADGDSAVAGTVVARGTNTPLAGVLVRVGGSGSEDDSEPLGGLARSDEVGRFRIAGLASGQATVLARADGLALFRGSVAVPSQGEASLTLELEPEAALAGHVRDAAGAPLAGIRVNVGEVGGPFEATATTAADGGFRVGALEAGHTLLAWIDERRIGHAQTEFASAAGTCASWEAVLERGGEIRGRVLDAAGEPLAGWSVKLSDEGYFPKASDRDWARTEADGSFVFVNVHDRAHDIEVAAARRQEITLARRTGVRPGAEELVLRIEGDALASARIVGTFLDEQARAVADAEILVLAAGQNGSMFSSCDPSSGRFELGPYPPRYTTVHLRAPGRAPFTFARSLAAGETWDLGTLRLAPEGTLRVQLVPLELELTDDLWIGVSPMEPMDGSELERWQLLPPGRHILRMGGGSYAEANLPFEIESGVDTVLEVPLLRGWRTPIGVRTSAKQAELRVTLPEGGVLTEPAGNRQGDILVGSFHLAPGSYSVEAVVGALRTSGTLVVEPEDRTEPVLVLSLE